MNYYLERIIIEKEKEKEYEELKKELESEFYNIEKQIRKYIPGSLNKVEKHVRNQKQ